MGLKGNLSSVSLAEVFQTLSTGNSTGLLRVQAPEGPRFVELQNGAISIAGRSAGRVMLGDLLISRGLIDDGRLDEALRMQKETGKMLGEVLIESGAVSLDQLENALRFQIEEEVCELFALKNGDFDFLDGAGLDSRMAPAGGLVRVNLNLNDLLAEAARRAEEWAVLEQRIPSQSMLFETSAQGDELLKGNDGLSPEGMILLRLAKTHRTVEAMVQKACLGRFTTNRMLLELWDAGILKPAPLKNYDRAAKEHLRLNRYEEAQRVAELMLERGSAEEKEQGKALLQEISKSRKPPAPSTSAYVKADPKVRSEVIRRNQPGLILKKEKSYLPLVFMAVLILGGIGAGAYFMFFREKSVETRLSRQQLELIAGQAGAYIAEGKYREGLQLLREFRSFDSGIQKQANELFENRQRDVEAMLARNIDKFNDAQKSGSTEEIEKAEQALQPLLDISVIEPELESMRNKARKEINSRRDRLRTGQFDAKIKELEAAAKDKGGEALLQAYEALLAENPPAASAVKIRAAVLQLRTARAEAGILMARARTLREFGDLETARFAYDQARQRFPTLSQESEKAIAEMAEASAASQAQFDKAQVLITQNKPAEAREALLKFLDSKPPQHLWSRALLALHGLGSAAEPELMAEYKAAAAQWEKQPGEARRKIVELAGKNPYSNTAALAILKVKVSSQPDGANVSLNGKPMGTTPATLDIPARGLVRITLSKEGFRSEEILRSSPQDDTLEAALERLPSKTVLFPAAASGGIAISSDTLLAVAGRDILQCSRDLKINSQIRLPGAAPAGKMPAPPLAAWRGEAFITEAGTKVLYRLDLVSGNIRQLDLEQPAASIPIPFNSSDNPPAALLGVATQAGFESFKDEDGKAQKRVRLGEAAAPPPGMTFDGELFHLPRPGGVIVAVSGAEGLKKWESNAGGEISGPPAYQPAAKVLAVASAGGRVSAFDRASGKLRWKQELKEDCVFGVQALGDGFCVAQKGGTVQALAGDTGQPGWKTSVPGDPALPPLVLRASNKDSALALCTRQGEGNDTRYYLVVLSADNGALLWRKTLDTAPAAIAADEQRLYISCADATLMAFDLK